MAWCQCIRTLLFEKGVKTILMIEILYQFACYGVQAMMFLFLMHELHASMHHAVALVHLSGFLCHTSTVIGYLISGRPISNNKAIWLFAVVDVVGYVMILVAAIAPGRLGGMPLLASMILLSSFGFTLRSLGGGGIKAAVSQLEDHVVSTDRTVRGHYFAFLFYGLGIASCAAVLAAPWLRMHFECVGLDYCFPYGFAVPGLALALARLFVLCLANWYHEMKTDENIIAKILKCISVARSNPQEGGKHWLDAAEGSEFDATFINDVKTLLRSLIMFIPLPIFWAIFGQMWSRWIFQATAMNGIVNDKITLEPDSMAFLNPLFIVFVIPLLEFIFFPLITLCHVVCNAPSHRACLGGVMALLALLAAGYVQLLNEPTLETPLQEGEINIFFWNPMICPLEITTDIKNYETLNINKLDIYRIRNYAIAGATFTFTLKSIECHTPLVNVSSSTEYTFTAEAENTKHILFDAALSEADAQGQRSFLRGPVDTLPFQDFSRSLLQLAKFGLVLQVHPNNLYDKDGNLTDTPYPPHEVLTISDVMGGHKLTPDLPDHTLEANAIDFLLKTPGRYQARVSGNHSQINNEPERASASFDLERAGVYVFSLIRKPSSGVNMTSNTTIIYTMTMPSLTKPPTISILWQTPQFAFISLAQYLWPATVLHYAMRKVTASMQAAVVACYALTNAVGDMLVAILAVCNFFSSDFYNYVLFAILMACTLPGLIVIAFINRDYDHEDPDDKSVELSSGDYSPQQSPERSPEVKQRRSRQS